MSGTTSQTSCMKKELISKERLKYNAVQRMKMNKKLKCSEIDFERTSTGKAPG